MHRLIWSLEPKSTWNKEGPLAPVGSAVPTSWSTGFSVRLVKCRVRGRGGGDTDCEGNWVFGPVFFRGCITRLAGIAAPVEKNWWEDPPPNLCAWSGVVECFERSPINFEMHFNITQPVRSRAWLELTGESALSSKVWAELRWQPMISEFIEFASSVFFKSYYIIGGQVTCARWEDKLYPGPDRQSSPLEVWSSFQSKSSCSHYTGHIIKNKKEAWRPVS